MRGKLAMLIPTKISREGVNVLQRELTRQRIKVLGKEHDILITRWDRSTRAAVRKGLSIQSYYVDRIPPAQIGSMPENVARVARLWNWSISRRGRKVADGEISRLMRSLKLEIRENNVYDLLTRKTLGKVDEEEEEETKGNWCLRQNRGWYRIPVWFGYWEKLWCRSRTYVNYPQCSGARRTMDIIVAEVDGPQHYGWNTRYNGSVAYTSDWDYIWVGESHCGTAYSWARLGNSSASITSRIC